MPSYVNWCSSILVGGATHSLVGREPSTCFKTSAAARKCPMLVMQEPIKTSSILVPVTSESVLTSSGSLGQANNGSLISFKSISIILKKKFFLDI